MNIVFFGTPNFAQIILKSLINNDNFNIAAIVTQPDKPMGRKHILALSSVKQSAAENNIEALQPVKLKDPEFINRLKKIGADVFVVASYGKIIPKGVLEIPKYGCINVHGSILPKYRGASPIQYALLNGDEESGVTIMLMDEGMDTGTILSQEKIEINPEDNFPSLAEKMAHLGSKMLDEILPKWAEGKIVLQRQDDLQATYTKIFKAEDYKIDWNKSAEEIKNQVRAMYPEAYGMVKIGEKEMRIKILETGEIGEIKENKEIRNQKSEIGRLFNVNTKLFCLCGKDGLELILVQPEGKKVMLGKDFLNGHKEI